MKVRSPKSKVRSPGSPVCGGIFARWSALLIFLVGQAFGGAGSTEEAPSLQPPHPEIPPSYWEENGTWIVVVSAVALVLLVALVWLLTRKRPARAVPPDIEAKAALDALSRLPEDGRVVSQVSQVLKRYFIAAFRLPAGELTTTEFRRSLEASARIESGLADEVGEFLHRCDQYKFAPASEAAPGAAHQARTLVEKTEAGCARNVESSRAGESQPVSNEA